MTEAKTLQLEVITPERLAYKDEVDFVVIPGAEGEIGILPEHAPLLSQLAAGELRIAKGAETEFFAVSGGFAEVLSNQVRVFAETAEMAKEIDVERARLAAERAKKDLTSARTQEELEMAEAAIRRALIRLRVFEGLSGRKRK